NHKNANQVPQLEVLSLLEQQLNQKDMQLQEKDEQIKQMQKLLDQQQQLTLQANQQIEKLQEQLQLTYTEESSENKSTILSEETESIEKQSKTEKKWWQFWQ
ncbi:TPA: DUF536 domain-containing protein, partial [Enterococcus faecium]